jgi:hypothetical protein
MKQLTKSAVRFGVATLARQVGLAIANRLRWQTTPAKPLVKPRNGGRLHVQKALVESLLLGKVQ